MFDMIDSTPFLNVITYPYYSYLSKKICNNLGELKKPFSSDNAKRFYVTCQPLIAFIQKNVLL